MIISKAKYQLIARCSYDKNTGSATYENYIKYYPKSTIIKRKTLFSQIPMKRQKRYITFYKIKYSHLVPYFKEYGLMCTRSYWECFKLGLRHIKQGTATFFTIEKIKKA